MTSEKLILVTNDDGVRAEGIKALASSLRHLGKVVVVAPELEQSASSHSITLDNPLRIKEYASDRFSVTGTPTDCVLLAVHRILGRKPDILVSGINHGPNMGEDVIYSGTVAAAIEGYILGIPSISVAARAFELLAQILLPIEAEPASTAAGENPSGAHPLSDPKSGDFYPQLVNYANRLVSRDDGKLRWQDSALNLIELCSADTAGRYPHQYFAGPRLGDRQVREVERFTLQRHHISLPNLPLDFDLANLP